MKKTIIAGLLIASIAGFSSPTLADDNDAEFFQSVEGKWTGPGEIKAGKYKGTKFNCKLEGSTHGFVAGMKLDGTCNVGIFSQAMKANVVWAAGTYQGEFNDGSTGSGLDVISGFVSGDKVTLSLNRKELNGIMSAHVTGDDSMNVIVSVKLDDELIPVIDMKLKKADSVNSRNIARN